MSWDGEWQAVSAVSDGASSRFAWVPVDKEPELANNVECGRLTNNGQAQTCGSGW